MNILDEIKKVKNYGENKKKIAVLYEGIPEEIITAAGFIPYRVFVDLKLSDDRGYLQKNICSYSRMILAEFLSGKYDDFVGVVAANTCDAMRRMFEVLELHKKFGYSFMLDFPRLDNEDAKLKYLKDIEEFRDSLKKKFKVFITNDKIRNAIEIHNETRKILKEFCVCRKENKINSIEMNELFKLCMQMDRAKFNDFAKKLIKNLEVNVNDKPSVILSGSVVSNKEILNAISKYVNPIIEENNIVTRNCWNEIKGNDLNSIAEIYLRSIPSPRMETKDRIEHIKNLLEFYNAKGILYLSFKFCDIHHFSSNILRERLKVPFLKLEIDYPSFDLGQIETRVQTFGEMLK